nr:putative cytochrome C biosynthesis protein [Ipomoea batatas]
MGITAEVADVVWGNWRYLTDLKMKLADAYSSDTVIASSPGKEVHDSWAFYLHAALLRQAFAIAENSHYCLPRSLGRVSVPVWLIILSNQLLIIALVSSTTLVSGRNQAYFGGDCDFGGKGLCLVVIVGRCVESYHRQILAEVIFLQNTIFS